MRFVSSQLAFALILICSFLYILPTGAVQAGGSAPPAYNAAMRSFGVWEAEDGERVDLSVWYPSRIEPQQKVQEGWVIEASRRSRIVPGFYPIVLISHDQASSRFANNDLAASLARAGMIVVVPTHTGDSQNDTSLIHSAEILKDRPRHLLRALETLLASPDFAPYADESRIGLLGVGMGSITVMQLAGAMPDFSLVGAYCDGSPEADALCAPWTSRRLAQLPKDMRAMRNIEGAGVFTPPLDIFSPELVSVPVPPDLILQAELAARQARAKSPSLWERVFGRSGEEEETPAKPGSPEESAATDTKEKGNSSPSFSFVLDFQGGDLFGGTSSGSSFVHIALPDSPQFRLAVANDSPATAPSPEGGLHRDDSSRAFRRLPEHRRIRSIALMVPAGGMFFSRQSLSGIHVPVAMIEAGKDTLYPPQAHAQPYFAQLPTPPLVMAFEEADHFSFFAPCSREVMANLSEACGRIQGEARSELAIARDNFLVPFFQSVLGEPLTPPSPSGFVAVEAGQ